MNLEGAKDPSDIQRKLREYAAEHPKALALADITRETPDPPNGTIVRDPQTGEATGALKESAQDLVAKVIPKPTRGDKLLALRAGIKWASEHGITRVHGAGRDLRYSISWTECAVAAILVSTKSKGYTGNVMTAGSMSAP